MHALVGADRQRAADIDQRIVVVRRQRLLDQRHAGLGAGGEILREVVRGPAFVGIDDQSGMRRGAAHGRDARRVVRAAELDLQQRAAGGLRGCRRHHVGAGERDRVGGGDGVRHRQARRVRGPAGPHAWLPDPRTRSRAHCAPRPPPSWSASASRVEAKRDGLLHAVDRGDHAVDGLAVARIRHAFAASAVPPVGKLGDHDLGLRLGAAADGEAAGDRPAFDLHGQRWGCMAHLVIITHRRRFRCR